MFRHLPCATYVVTFLMNTKTHLKTAYELNSDQDDLGRPIHGLKMFFSHMKLAPHMRENSSLCYDLLAREDKPVKLSDVSHCLFVVEPEETTQLTPTRAMQIIFINL